MSFPQKLFNWLAFPVVLSCLLFCQTGVGALAQTRDVAGAKDYPGIGRFGGSVITGYR